MNVQLPRRYVPHGSINGGGMSEVVLCKDQHLDRLVVIKALSAGVDSRRILDELAALQSIRSKHVVQIFDVIRGNDGHVAAIVEEYLPGDDLTSIPPPKTATEFLKLLYPIAEGIADIYEHKMVHRDIKPINMKYDAEKCLKIFDFGLTRAGVDASTIGIIGTRGYMAPELFRTTRSGRVSFTEAVDTFAFGATALACLIRRFPRDLLEMPPKLPCKDANFSNLTPSMPPEIAELLNQCLDADPCHRPRMSYAAKLIGLHLLRNRHRALLVTRSNSYVLDENNRVAELSVRGQGSLTITYDGLRFVISKVSGHVAINNMPVSNNDVLPGSCVIVLGPINQGAARTMITVDVSHPEVTI
jgi:serine/threonine protein kinase